MTPEEIKALRNKGVAEAEDVYYTVKDDEGTVQPRAGLWESSGYGLEAAQDAIKRMKGCTITKVRITEI